jgi:hypothetical protein
LRALPRAHTEAIEECFSENDGGSYAEAPPPSFSSEEAESFDLPGYGPVYRHDLWALQQPDSRPLYLKRFGLPRKTA